MNRPITLGLIIAVISVIIAASEIMFLHPLSLATANESIIYFAFHTMLDCSLICAAILVAYFFSAGVSRSAGGRLTRTTDRLTVWGVLVLVFACASTLLFLLRGWLHPFVDQQLTFLTSDKLDPWICAVSFAKPEGGAAPLGFYEWIAIVGDAWQGAQFDVAIFCLCILVIWIPVFVVSNLRRWVRSIRHAIARQLTTAHWSFGNRLRSKPLILAVLLCIGLTVGAARITDMAWTSDQAGDQALAHAPEKPGGSDLMDPCRDPRQVRTYKVSAINVEIVLNRFGDRDPHGYMYALDKNISRIRHIQKKPGCIRWGPDGPDAKAHQPCVSSGLRDDLIQPLVLRANLGQCVRIEFTNRLIEINQEGENQNWPAGNINDGMTPSRLEAPIPDDGVASLTIHGLAHWARKEDNAKLGKHISRDGPAGGQVGRNPDTFAKRGETVVYEIPLPRNQAAEGSYYFHDGGGNRQRISHGLFGALIVEPAGARYLDPETGRESDGTGWQAIIQCPRDREECIRPDGSKVPDFREFALIYHEIGDEGNESIIRGSATDSTKTLDQLIDDLPQLGQVYRSSGRAINYRSEPFLNRLQIDRGKSNVTTTDGGKKDFRQKKSLAYSSYSFGDPATPIPRSYLGEPTKTRLIHGGSEVFHVHHLHGGAIRWRRNPKSDPTNDISSGLTKIPVAKAFSTRLDSQTIGPGTSFNLEHECGAGGCQQAAGDFLFHCHIGQHYVAGMWSFWRVYDTRQADLAPLPDRIEPPTAVTSDKLVGKTFGGMTIVSSKDEIVDENKQIALQDWVGGQLPPPDSFNQEDERHEDDATYWDWRWKADKPLVAVGEKETTAKWVNYKSATPGKRPDILFNPTNGRYTWPLMRPHLGRRPPFSPNGHAGTSWLPDARPTQRTAQKPKDLLCPQTPELATRTIRHYPISAVPIEIRKTYQHPDDRNKKPTDKQDLYIGSETQRYDGATGELFVLNEDIASESKSSADGKNWVKLRRKKGQDDRAYQQSIQPLAIRSGVGDCLRIILTSRLNDHGLDDAEGIKKTKVNIHTHFVQFDPQSSDGVITGMSYEQSVRPYRSEGRWLVESTEPGTDTVVVNHTKHLRPGIWIGIGLGKGMCNRIPGEEKKFQCDKVKVAEKGVGKDAIPHTEIVRIKNVEKDCANNNCTIVLDSELKLPHLGKVDPQTADEAESVGVEFVQYDWYSDVDSGTVFWHDHVDFNSWDRGLVGAHIIEPPNTTWHDPSSGKEVRSGNIVDVRDAVKDRNSPISVGAGQTGDFREFVLFNHRRHSKEQQFGVREATINLKAEPLMGPGTYRGPGEDGPPTDDNNTPLFGRGGEPAHWFSSYKHGDPFTPLPRAYVGDPFVVRQVGVEDRAGGIRITGHRFRLERWAGLDTTRRKLVRAEGSFTDTSPAGISERYDLILDGGAGGPMKLPGDYLYYNTIGRDFMGGAWGLIRVYDNSKKEAETGLRRLQGSERDAAVGNAVFPPPKVKLPSGLTKAIQLSKDGVYAIEPKESVDPLPGGVSDGNKDRQVCPYGSRDEKYDITIGKADVLLRALSPANGSRIPTPIKAMNAVTYSVSTGDQATPVVFDPLVLRVSKGDCLTVRLTNRLQARGPSGDEFSRNCEPSKEKECGARVPAGHAGLSVGELPFDPQKSYGLAVGLNRDSSVPPGESRIFRYYADKELGVVIALNLANPALAAKGSFAAVVVEPESSRFWHIDQDKEHRTGITSRIVSARDGKLRYDEVVSLFHDNDPDIGHNAMPYPMQAHCREERQRKHRYTRCRPHKVNESGTPSFTSMSFQAHPWLEQKEGIASKGRNFTSAPSYVYSTTKHAKTHEPSSPLVLRTKAGRPVMFRVGLPWGEQTRVFSMEGHRWPLEPRMPGSEHVFSRNLIPGYTFDAPLIGGAGGPYMKYGDYLILDTRQSFARAGAWGIMRVEKPHEEMADDER